MRGLQKETAPPGGGTAPTHKEAMTSSGNTITGWREDVIAWYKGGSRPGPSSMRLALDHGLSQHLPTTAKSRARALAVAGFDIEDVLEAVPGVPASQVVEWVDRIPAHVQTIIDYHRRGYTAQQIAGLLSVERGTIYYWLRQAGVRPNRTQRPELTSRQRAAVSRAYKAGEPMTQIAYRLGISYEQVRYAVKAGK